LPARGEYSAQRIFAVPPGKEIIEYNITWTLNKPNKDNRKKLVSGNLSSDETVIFCDELP